MRHRGLSLLLLASSLTFLVSLYVSWETWRGPHGSFGSPLNGWFAEAGAIAALVALTLAFAAVALLIRPQLVARWTVGSLAVVLGYLAVGVALQVHGATTARFVSSTGYPHYSWAYGSWIGLAAGGVALLGGAALWRRDLFRRPDASGALAVGLGLGVLASSFMPWIASPGFGWYPGLEAPAATLAALVLLFGARRLQLPLTVAVAVLVGAATTIKVFPQSSLSYGACLGLGCAVALVALQALRARPWRVPAAPRGAALVRSAAALVLVVALFLPWERLQIQIPGGAFTVNGWQELSGAAAGALALLLLAAPALPYAVEAVTAIAFLVASTGTGFGSFPGFRVAYGAYVGFAATALLVVGALMTLRPVALNRRRARVVAVPLAASVCSLGAVVVPTWNILPESWPATAVTGWFVVAGVLIAIYLIRAWTRGGHLVMPALSLLALPVFELILRRDELGLIWGIWILIGLCLLLVVLGWIEEYGGGLGSFRIPEEIWRVDRLPGEN
ncbi:MAG TPA: hypothetical protein VKR79_04085 [Gaiellaceae bacterium]|nr:hypothetical protein [Gaiellaceae bacterium]